MPGRRRRPNSSPLAQTLLALTCVLGLLGVGAGRARADEDPDTEIARRHFEAGRRAYEDRDYASALGEFQQARTFKSSPALDFNIARCLDRMEQPAEAIAAYRRYLDGDPSAEDAPEVRLRIVVLEDRVAKARSTPPSDAPTSTSSSSDEPADSLGLHPDRPRDEPTPRSGAARYDWSISVGALALASGAVGAGLLGWVASDFNDLKRTCGSPPMCPRESWGALPNREIAADALLITAGVLAIVDIALWVKQSRAPARRAEPAVARTLGIHF